MPSDAAAFGGRGLGLLEVSPRCGASSMRRTTLTSPVGRSGSAHNASIMSSGTSRFSGSRSSDPASLRLHLHSRVAAQVSLENTNQLIKVVELLKIERGRLFKELQKIPFLKPYPTQSNFILCQVLERDALDLKTKLANEHGIFIRYFNKPDLRDCIRISVGRPEDTDALIKALINGL